MEVAADRRLVARVSDKKLITSFSFWVEGLYRVLGSYDVLCVKACPLAESPECKERPPLEEAGGAGCGVKRAGHVIPTETLLLS